MAVDLTDEIVQDFLVEAGEILEQLGGQLVDLEQRPDDRGLLNSVFRGFHTIKGGAGFIGLDALVEVSHKAEDTFDLLRKGARQVTPSLMDVILQVLDVLNTMFDSLRAGEDPQRAPAALLASLAALARNDPWPEAAAVPVVQAPAKTPLPVPAETSIRIEAEGVSDLTLSQSTPAEGAVDPMQEAGAAAASGEDITEAEFDALLDELDSQRSSEKSNAVEATTHGGQSDVVAENASDEITEGEFEALLDELGAQRSGHADPAPALVNSDDITEAEFDALLDELNAKKQQPPPPAPSDEITEAEFDALLDDLHGKQQFIGKPQQTPGTETHQVAADASSSAQTAPGRDSQPQQPVRVSETLAAVVGADLIAEGKGAPSANKAGKAANTPAAQADSTVRVETSVLDRIMNMVGELVLIRNRISTLEASLGDDEMTKTASILDVVTSDLQAAVMKTRMQPVKKVFGRFPRVVRDLARSLKKEVNLELHGEETDLDKNLVEALADPLVHLVRNAVDHGIEMPAVRVAAGKPSAGTLVLSAAQEGDHILLTIADDGAGMDPEVLRRKAVEKGLMDEDAAARLDEQSCYELIFAAGFSTKAEISDISGRGVGMDVVKTRINQLNGTIHIQSRLGQGTSIIVKLPLTLAIVPTLMVVLGKQIFALPLVNVNEIIDFDKSRMNVVDGREVMVVRGRVLPLFYLGQWLIRDSNYCTDASGHVVVVSIGASRFGLIVDQLIGQEEVVIKPLGAMLHGTKGLAGATITGDGRIALILDLPGLVNAYARR